jgi:hypothetical protein
MVYLESDVALLAEVFENYRQTSMKMFGLDPARFVSVQSMTMTNWLKYSGLTILKYLVIDLCMNSSIQQLEVECVQ